MEAPGSIGSPKVGSQSSSANADISSISSKAGNSVEAQNASQQLQNQREAARRQKVAASGTSQESSTRNRFESLGNEVAREISRQLSSSETDASAESSESSQTQSTSETRGRDGAPEPDFEF